MLQTMQAGGVWAIDDGEQVLPARCFLKPEEQTMGLLPTNPFWSVGP